MLDSGNLLPDLREVKKLHKIRSKVDENCARGWADIFKTPVLWTVGQELYTSRFFSLA